ncbi:MAG: hypothetical protein E7612_09215 [Ruminococcaceae bacterium]|nr:hypothetical protein [Oscillospiraceae bacterium]
MTKKELKDVIKGFASLLIIVALLSFFVKIIGSAKIKDKLDTWLDGEGSSDTGNPGGSNPGEDGSGGSSGNSGNNESEESECSHVDANDDNVCDKCGVEFSDGDDTTIEPDAPYEPEEPECEHVDANDDNVCDKCGAEFSDGDDTTEPEEPECEHVDANDDNVCDKCGAEFSDGDDTTTEPEEPECEHVDANDDNVCDKCGAEFSDGDDTTEPEEPECEHVDANDDNVCDKCGIEFSDGNDSDSGLGDGDYGNSDGELGDNPLEGDTDPTTNNSQTVSTEIGKSYYIDVDYLYNNPNDTNWYTVECEDLEVSKRGYKDFALKIVSSGAPITHIKLVLNAPIATCLRSTKGECSLENEYTLIIIIDPTENATSVSIQLDPNDSAYEEYVNVSGTIEELIVTTAYVETTPQTSDEE